MTRRTKSDAITICSTHKVCSLALPRLVVAPGPSEIIYMGRKRLRGKQPVVSTSNSRAETMGKFTSTFLRLFANGWPVVMFNLLFMANAMGVTCVPDSDGIGFFSGVANVVKAFNRHIIHKCRLSTLGDSERLFVGCLPCPLFAQDRRGPLGNGVFNLEFSLPLLGASI